MKSTITAILVDDEMLAIKRLRRLLEPFSDYINIVTEALNGNQAVELIELHKPDLVFLDIEMPGLNGFEVLSKISHLPMIIFTTAFDAYALKAFEENSIDYLLKPIESERLDKAIDKIKRFNTNDTNLLPNQLDSLLDALKPKREFRAIPVKIGDKVILIKPDQITYLEAKDKYVFLKTDEGKEYLSDFTLNSLEEKLPDNFIRVHRAFIVNTDKIKEIHKGFNSCYTIVVKDLNKTKIQTGRSYIDQVRSLFQI